MMMPPLPVLVIGWTVNVTCRPYSPVYVSRWGLPPFSKALFLRKIQTQTWMILNFVKVVSNGGKRPFRWDKISLFAEEIFRYSGARLRQFIPKISSSGVQLPVWRKLSPGISCEVNFLPRWTPPHTGLIFSGILFSRKIEILFLESCNKTE